MRTRSRATKESPPDSSAVSTVTDSETDSSTAGNMKDTILSNGSGNGAKVVHADELNEATPLIKVDDHGAAVNGDAGVSGKGKWRKPRLLTFEESLRLVPWQTDNEHVKRGYRPQLRSIRSCLYSAIGYIHNETVNIHSHSIGAAFFAALLPLHLFPSHFPTLGVFPPASILPPSTGIDKACMACYFVCAVTCLGLSSWFHTVQCCTREVCNLAHCGDYVGIVVLIVGSILPGMYYSFHDQPLLQGLYMSGIVAAGLTSGYIVLSPHHRNHRWDRTLTFIALGLSAVIPVGHVVLSRGLTYARDMMGFDYILLGGVSYIFGALLYAARIPERFIPGKVDFIGNSHQIFHCFVLLGAWFQFAALRWMHVGRAMVGM